MTEPVAISPEILLTLAIAGGALGLFLPSVIAVMIAASNCCVTPIGCQTNLFVFGPGDDRFGDFLRVGTPLTVLSVAVATFVIPCLFPFDGR